MNKKYLTWFAVGIVYSTMTTIASGQVRMNQIQVIGTHNSYHIQPHPSVMSLIRQTAGGQADAIAYTHRPLREQLVELGMRQFELDVYADPEGGHYAEPMAIKLLENSELPVPENHDPNGELRQPGLKVIHAPDIDYLTTVKTFVGALQQIKQWSDSHPRHVPIMVLVEVKQSRIIPLFPKPKPFDQAALDSIDQEILSVFSNDQVITPDLVRGDHETLRDAVTSDGWPELERARGKVIFALDNGGDIRDRYLRGHPALKGRILFVSVDADHPAAGFMKMNNPIQGFDQIQTAVKQGFIVRTRADSNTREARQNDATTRDKAFASGAQYISTDYPEPNRDLSDYQVQFPGNVIARPNPINGDGKPIETTQP